MKKIFLVLFLILTSCGSGVATGNPNAKPKGSVNASPRAPSLADSTLPKAICTLLVGCFSGQTLSSCEDAVVAQTNINAVIGAQAAQYSTLLDTLYAEYQGRITSSSTALSQCVTSIAALSCSNSLVIAAYQPSQSDPYVGVAAMLPTGSSSCSGIY